MKPQEILEFTAKLIEIRSLSGQEASIVDFLASHFVERGWNVERLSVEQGRDNLFVTWGTPHIVFTTHVDVVDAPEHLFSPVLRGETLFGRGACDAKGIAATMIGVANELANQGASNFGILLVVGEEHDGRGARAAALALKNRGIRFLINGEPTEGALMRAHKGGLGLTISFTGRAGHSGYPELGVDANRALIEVGQKLLSADFGCDRDLGDTTVNIGCISGGVQGNMVSPSAKMVVLLRTVRPNAEILASIKCMIPPEASITVDYDMEAVRLLTLPGFKIDVAKYCTDIPFLAPIGAQALLYGPGSILRAHTDEEFITLSEIEEARHGYHRLFNCLTANSLNRIKE